MSGEKQFAWLALATLLLFVGVAIYASFSRGLWLDEAWSILEGQHDLPLGEVVRTRWLTEISPPFFYIMSWIFQPLTGDGVFARRLLNLLPLILAVLAFVMLWRRYPHRSTLLLLLGLLVVSHPAAITYFPEHRAYFAILAGSTVLAAAFSVIILEGTDYDRRDRGPLFVAFAGMLGVFSLHYIVAFQVGAVVAIVIVGLWLLRLWRWSVALALAAFVAGLPIVLTFVAQRQVLQGFGDKGWIRTEPTIAIFILGLVIGTSLLTSGVAAVAASRQLTARTSSEALKHFGVIMSVALVGSWALLMIANWRQPMVIERYLIAYSPFILALIAVFAADTIAADKVFRWAVALFAIALIVVNGTSVAREERWFATGRMIAQVQQQCATATVHAVPYWRVREGPYLFGPNESVALRIGLDQVADAFGIKLQPDGSRTVSSDCPTILWVEHYDYRQTTTAKVIAASALTLDPTSSLRANAQVGETGFILVIPPPESRSAARP